MPGILDRFRLDSAPATSQMSASVSVHMSRTPDVGYDQTQAFGNHHRKLGYGGSAGFDGNLTDRIVVGPEVTYRRHDNGRTTVRSDDSVVAHQGRDTWRGAVRMAFAQRLIY